MTDEFFVVDVDAHYQDNLDVVEDHFDDDDPWKRRFYGGHGKGDDDWESPFGYIFPTLMESTPGFYKDRHPIRTTEDCLEIMDILGVDSSLMISNQALMFHHIKADDQRQSKFANAYVDYMLEEIVDPDKGVNMVIPIPHNEPYEAVELIERTKDERAVKGIFFTSALVEPPLGNRKYDPIYEAAEDAGLPIVFHGDTDDLDSWPFFGYSSSLSTRHLGFMWSNTGMLTSLIAQGVPEKFPDLDFVFMESGIFWIPMQMYRMDAEYLKEPWNAPLLEKRPSEYMKEMYFGTQPLDDPPDPKYFEWVIEMIGGADRLVYASDYPHKDYDEVSTITDMPFLSDEEKAKILGENAREVFDL